MAKPPDFKHQPSPSAYLRQKGNIVDESYHLAEGHIIFSDTEIPSLECKFEVAYMQNATAWAVVYIEFTESIDEHVRHEIPNLVKQHKIEVIEGREDIWGRIIRIEIRSYATITRSLSSLDEGTGLRLLFRARRYEVIFDKEPETGWRYFYIANLPMHRIYKPDYSLQVDRRDFQEEKSRHILKGIIDFLIDEPHEMDGEALKQVAHEKVHQLQLEYPGNDEVFRRKHISLYLNNDEIGRLYWNQSQKNRSYPLEPLTRLILIKEKLPDNWSEESLANWICRLFSIGLGADIQWIHWHTSSEDRFLPANKHVWVSQSIEDTVSDLFPFAVDIHEANLVFRENDIGLHQKTHEWVYFFVETILRNVVDMGEDKCTIFLNIIEQYIHYRSIPAVLQVRTTLLAVMAEYIFKKWQEDSPNAPKLPKHRVTKAQRRKIRAAVEEKLRSIACTIFPPKEDEDAEQYLEHFNDFVSNINDGISQSFSDRLKAKLEWFFNCHGYSESHYIYDNVDLLVKSRNALAHDHEFASDRDSSININAEISNVEMMIPLMIALILGYEGRYYDGYKYLQNNWRHGSGYSWTPNGR
ncbi:MAG: hypothetical protein L0154_06290 [Chloroflexi bacterium]|nr:hypothetical protein [Chloroflexota bacterium]